jgi:hypothetical protein
MIVAILLIAFKIINKNSETINYHNVNMVSNTISIKTDGGKKNIYEIPRFRINNGELYVYKIDGKEGFNLKEGDNVIISLNIKSDNKDHCVIGYLLDGDYNDFFSGQVDGTLDVNFKSEKSGIYYFYSVGASANFTNITSGEFKILN